MLEQTVQRYQNRSIEADQVIAELIELAKEIRAAGQRGEDLGLTEDELAFYDALEVNDSAVKLIGDETTTSDRPRVSTANPAKRHDWLDSERKYSCQAPNYCKTTFKEIRLSPRQTGKGDDNCAATGRVTV